MIKKIIGFVVFLFLLVLIFKTEALAVTVSISNYPTTITSDPFTITASVSGATAGTNYLRIDLYKDSTSNYFGETYNGSDWYGGSTYTQYLPITVQSGVSWQGDINARIGSPTSTQYDATGTYRLRLRRYTSGGGYTSSEANNSSVVVLINVPTATPIPTDSPTPTNTPTPTNSPSNSPSPSTTKTPTPTKKITPSPTSTSQEPKEKAATISSVLGENASNPSVSQAQEQSVEIASASQNILPKIFITLGVLFILACIGIVAYPYIRKFKEEKV